MKIDRVLVNQKNRIRVIKDCRVCGVKFNVQPSKNGRIQTCKDCRNVLRKPPVALVCQHCRAEFVAKGYLDGVQKYCSLRCKYLGQSTVHTVPWDRSPRICRGCEATFTPDRDNRRYCSGECFKRTLTIQDHVCHQCGTAFHKKRHVKAINRVFCSRKCKAQFYSGGQHPLWQDTRQTDDRGPGWDAIAESIRKRDGYRCQRCGKKQTARRKLDVHHKIPYRLTADNSPGNLVSLCPSCHKIVEHSPGQLKPIKPAPPQLFQTTMF